MNAKLQQLKRDFAESRFACRVRIIRAGEFIVLLCHGSNQRLSAFCLTLNLSATFPATGRKRASRVGDILINTVSVDIRWREKRHENCVPPVICGGTKVVFAPNFCAVLPVEWPYNAPTVPLSTARPSGREQHKLLLKFANGTAIHGSL